MLSRLEREWPDGDPQSVSCRHCHRSRVRGRNGALVCTECDGNTLDTMRAAGR